MSPERSKRLTSAKRGHKPKEKWRSEGIASARKQLLPKTTFAALVVTLALVTNSCQLSNFNHGGFSNGDPAPGRSPGPPKSDDLKFERAPYEPVAILTSQTGSAGTATKQPHVEWNIVGNDTSKFEKVNEINGSERIVESDECYLNSDIGKYVTVIEKEAASLNLTFENSIFKSDAELVKGVTYEVVLNHVEADDSVIIFSLESFVNEEDRGDFVIDHKVDHICTNQVNNNKINRPLRPHRDPTIAKNDIATAPKPNKTKEAEEEERNELPVWESLNVETKNDILDDYKLENKSELFRQPSKYARFDNANEATDQNSNSVVRVDNINGSNPQQDDVDSASSVDNSKVIKRRRNTIFKRETTNFLVTKNNEDFVGIPGLYVDSKSHKTTPEVVKGHSVYGMIPKGRRNIRLRWRVGDSRLGEGRLANVTLRLCYKLPNNDSIFQVTFTRTLKFDCQLSLYRPMGRVAWTDLPRSLTDCQVFFPSASMQKHGMLVTLERLNVPCLSGGFIRFSSGKLQVPRSRSYQPTHLCGKLEELPESERNLYFSATESKASSYLHVHGTPLFVISYRLVDYCYNVTLTARNGSYEIEPTNSLHCTFRIHLPYGNRVALRLQMGEKPIKTSSLNAIPEMTTMGVSSTNNDVQDIVTEYSPLLGSRDSKMPECLGLSIKLWDGSNTWIHCSKSGDPLRNVQIISQQNSIVIYVVIRRTAKSLEVSKEDVTKNIKDMFKVNEVVRNSNDNSVLSADDVTDSSNVNKRSVAVESASDSSVISNNNNNISLGLFLKLWYHAEPVEDVVGQCSYGWVAFRQFCVAVFDHARLPWAQAEAECVREGGHLVSIRSEQDQTIVDQILLQGPGYREQNAYWIGASDKASEGDFRWSDGLPFSFTHWFPGWAAHGGYNRQPNDDGMSGQDCVEVRRAFSPPPPAPSRPTLSPSHRWNDRDCGAPNHYICERPLADEPVEVGSGGPACEPRIALGRARPRAALASPGFPRSYPDGAHCETQVSAPSGYRIVLDFEELVLEQEPDCSYDYLEIWEPYMIANVSLNSETITSSPSSIPAKRRLCGDWSSRLKLLRHVSRGPRLVIKFVSDYSHHYTGFKATLTMENVMECSDDRQKLFNDSCYLIVSYPEVTWTTAQQICRGARAQLASVLTSEEERFLTASIRNSADYSNSAIYWIGAKMTGVGTYDWTDGMRVTFSGWLPGKSPQEMDILELPDPDNPTCVGIQWTSSPSPMVPSGLYWVSQKCSHVGGYVCKRKNQLPEPNLKLNNTINDTEGRLTSPNYPAGYPNNLNYYIKLIGPENTRLVIQFSKIDMELQNECLYDFVEIRSIVDGYPQSDTSRICGNFDTDMRRFDFVSLDRSALVAVRSDYSVSGGGFSARWKAVDVSACPKQALTAKHGVVKSPNWPHFLLSKLDCTYTIIAPPGKRVWLEITEHALGTGATLDVNLGEGSSVRPFLYPDRLAEGAFLSKGETLELRLRTGDQPTGKGFSAIYKIVGFAEEERLIVLGNSSSGALLHVNHPRAPPPSSTLTLRLQAPPGCAVLLRLHSVSIISNEGECPEGRGKIEVFDSYADSNGTCWDLCEDLSLDPGPPLSITSYYNTLSIRQKSGPIGVSLNATVNTQIDVNYRTKLMQSPSDSAVESCKPNPCLNGGRCLVTNGKSSCQCYGHFTGMFCALTACELEPCVFGTCVLTGSGHRCACRAGYTGAACEARVKPCESRPCEGRGKCIERANGFHCNCYAWWEGTRCERRMMNIPYKPLSERMLQEPFWLGLITVFVVLAIIGLVWCAKRHFPEKIEKLLAEEADRNRPNPLSLRGAARDAAACQGPGPALAVNAGGATSGAGGAAGGGPSRGSLFNRLGIRKPSILSLSPGPPPAARTFSLDDLLRPPPRRTPSPRKKRNNSTPTKKNAAEKKQILQQLISPAASQNLARKVSMGELIQMSERRAKENDDGKLSVNGLDSQETCFEIGERSGATPTISIRQLSDPKLEKKVTFARLLNKVSAEMSSGSEIEIGGLSTSQNNKVKSSSTPPSPAADIRYAHSNSSNQGSDSISSLEAALPGMGFRKFSGRANKISSADSILAMFKNFSSSATGNSVPSSIVVSPSTTPSVSSPQDDVPGDDDSTTSSLHTPVSLSSGAPDSPVYYRQSNSQSNTIEVPVLDVLTAHKACISGSNLLHPPSILLEIPSTINKCLSPIRELPTPLPSPALTPIMHRSHTSSADYESDDHISMEIPSMSMSQTEDEDDENHSQNLTVLDGGLNRSDSRPNSSNSSLRLKVRPSPIGRDTSTPSTQMTDDTPSPLTHSHDSEREMSSSCGRATASPHDLSPAHPKLVIPLLTIEQPSPTRHYPTGHGLMFAGSPPPQRASIGETSFLFPNKQQQKRLLKEFEKPTSLDLAITPPLITITCNISEAESDAESASPANRAPGQLLAPPGPSTMCYLSPFSMCIRGDRTTSESNLSSSGYSSMASPGPSRCGSNNPLCPSEMEDPPGSGHSSHHPGLAQRRPSPLLKTTSNPPSTGTMSASNTEQKVHHRGRSDSETLSDDPLLESNDEGISTDHLEERIEDGELKSAKELEVFLKNEVEADNCSVPFLQVPSLQAPKCTPKCPSIEKGPDRLSIPTTTSLKMSLQLPSIVIQADSSPTCEKLLSPVSSRSESPLSDRTIGLGRFSPHFYNRHKEQFPFTDSDGLYDFPSSDCIHQNSSGSCNKINMGLPSQPHRKSTGRRRERKNSRTNPGSKTPSPTKAQLPHSMQNLLDVPGKDSYFRTPTPRKLSPKRRSRSQQPVSSSSSSESINSAREVAVRLTPEPKSPQSGEAGIWPKQEWAAEASGEETGEDVSVRILPKSPVTEETPKPIRKISRMRTIGHQIRFLRRLEQSLKQRERFTAVGNSDEEGDESSSVTSPLLQQSRMPRPQIKKSQSIGRIQPSVASVAGQRPKPRQKKGTSATSELLHSQDSPWRSSIGMAGPNDISD